MMGQGHNAWFGLDWMVVVVLIVLLLVLGLGIWAVIALTRGNQPASTATSVESPRQILDRRFAAGEIDQEQYVQMLHLIGGSAPQPPAR